MKKGTPMSAVTMPMGEEGPGMMDLESTEAAESMQAPAQGGEGIKSADLPPTSMRAIWGPPGRRSRSAADEAGGGGGEQGDQHQGLHAQPVDVDPEAAGTGFPEAQAGEGPGIPVDEQGADQGDDGGDDRGSPRWCAHQAAKQPEQDLLVEPGEERNRSRESRDWNRNSRAMPARIRVWLLTWRIMASPNSRQAANMHTMKAPAGMATRGEPEAAGVEGERRAQASRRREPLWCRDWRGVVQQGLHLHAAKAEGGADHQAMRAIGRRMSWTMVRVMGSAWAGKPGIDHVVQGQQGGAGGDVEHRG